MSIKWSTMRDNIRLMILKDVPVPDANGELQPTQFDDSQLKVAARWACVALANHTAQPDAKVYACDGSVNQFDLPEDIVDGVEKAGLIIYNDGQNLEYLAPVRLIPGTNWPTKAPGDAESLLRGYWEWPRGRLTLSFIPAADTLLEVRYFRIWTPPEGDDSMLDFPVAYEQPFAYLVGASAFDSLGAQASAIRTWNRKADSGTPEDNPLQKQSEFFLKMARERLRDIGPQDRETYYRNAPRDFGFER